MEAIKKVKAEMQHVQYGYEAIDELQEPAPIAPLPPQPSPYHALRQFENPPSLPPQSSAEPVVPDELKTGTQTNSKTKTAAAGTSMVKQKTKSLFQSKKRKYFTSKDAMTMSTTRK